MNIKWFGYRLTDGSIHLKRVIYPDDIERMMSRPNVVEVRGPWYSETFAEAKEKLKELVKG